MTTRLQQAFKTLRETGRKGVVPYITAGDPDLETTYELLVAMARAGATAIELGMPFSDPAADGPVIQRACERALALGVKLKHVIEVAGRAVKGHRSSDRALQLSQSAAAARLENWRRTPPKAGLAGVLVTDLPAESAQGFSQALQRRGLDLVSSVAPDLDRAAHRADRAARHRLSLRDLGHRSHRNAAAVERRCQRHCSQRIRRVTALPVAVGFGISNAEQAREAWAQGADAVIVGSAIVRKIEEFGAQAPVEVERFVRELVAAQAVEA